MVLGDNPEAGGDWAGLYHTRLRDDPNSQGFHATSYYTLQCGENGSTWLNCTGSGQTVSLQFEGSTKAYINSSGFVNPSDDRLKKAEMLLENATDILMKLTPQKYDKYDTMDCSGNHIVESGLIAQDIWYNAPELQHLVDTNVDASGNKLQPLPLPENTDTTQDIQNDPDYTSLNWPTDTPAGVNYIGIIPYLIKSNQEQQDLINNQKTQIDSLLASISSLSSRLDSLENP